ncbi:MAG: 4-hydroxythreonine-4-phosphate dehydrogenase PdxA [Clostridium sp.]|nr:4-hydroxythreonine-4-phosphate dehydrogenase PdxA [Clostridium sp.]
MKQNIRVGITHGDCNGIGYETILKALEDNRILEICTPVVYGSAKIAAFYRKGLELQPFTFQQVSDASEIRDGEYNIINVVGEDLKIEPGVESKAAGEAAVAALERAVADLRDGSIDLLVTAPISKHAIQSENFAFPGHTEFLQARLAEEESGDEALMILFNEYMRVALATVHEPLAAVPGKLSTRLIADKIGRFDRSLRRDFGVVRPRIAVLSLNPHAGEDGLLGTEEKEIIIPAIETVRDRKILAFGPYAADGFFGAALYRKFDGVLAMYHDQGLIPLKTLGMEAGVNFTAGLPYVRTSPDHGTAFDIAGKGLASGESMRQAIYSAIDILRHRESFDEMTANPLKKHYHEKNKSDNVVLDLSKTDD